MSNPFTSHISDSFRAHRTTSLVVAAVCAFAASAAVFAFIHLQSPPPIVTDTPHTTGPSAETPIGGVSPESTDEGPVKKTDLPTKASPHSPAKQTPAKPSSSPLPGNTASPAPKPLPHPTQPVIIPLYPSGVAMPSGTVAGWSQVFADDFSGAIKPQWTFYSGRYGQDLGGYASRSHVYNAGDVMHLYAAQDSSGYFGSQWYSGGACLCGKTGDAWLDVNDVRVTYRWRVVDDTFGLKPVYAFLRWPKAENWPAGGEEDFMEGLLSKGARTEVSMHGVDDSGQHKKHFWKPIDYNPTVWNTATYTRRGYTITLDINGQEVARYLGNEQSLPTNLKHIVFQQQCNEQQGCPSGGTSDVQIDWVVVSRPI